MTIGFVSSFADSLLCQQGDDRRHTNELLTLLFQVLCHVPSCPLSQVLCDTCNVPVSGLRTRTVQCIRDRRSVVEDGLCRGLEEARPRDSQPCHNTECAGVWVTGEWSQVSLNF